ncbi:MAG: antitoxin family protein [Acidobacteria bacterium]|nr:antitoxin family protein [Acidobacteriota bacterium]
MLPEQFRALFWDVNVETLDPKQYPDYTIGRVLEYGDDAAVTWMRENFSEADIKRVLMKDHTLSKKSANYWALVYRVPREHVAALRPEQDGWFAVPPPVRTLRARVKGGRLQPLEGPDLPEGKEVTITIREEEPKS